MKQHAVYLRQALVENHRLANCLDDHDFPLAEFEHVQDWQRQRLEKSYQGLISQERYRAAGDFFLVELYGGLNFRERDQQMERVLPVMVRMLRDDMIRVLAEAFDLQAMSLNFDMDMARALQTSGWDELNIERYGEIYRHCGRADEREKQSELIHRLGLELNELVHHRLVLLLIRTVRRPARVAGFGLLQSFLEHGLRAFQVMGDGTEFVETIWKSERDVMHRLLAGDKNPF